jgi:hypothetical protein
LRTSFERDRDQVAAARLKAEALERVSAAAFAVWVEERRYDVIIAGVAYRVVWHGGLDGPRQKASRDDEPGRSSRGPQLFRRRPGADTVHDTGAGA